MTNVVAFPAQSGVRAEAWELLRETPLQLLEIQQHVAPTHKRGAEDGSSHAKPSSQPPVALDPIDAIRAEEGQVIMWSSIYGLKRGTVGQRITFLAERFPDIPDWDLENLLERWRPIRAVHRRLWPTGAERQWLTEAEAVKLVGKDARTLRRWRADNPNLGRRTESGTEYHRALLRDMAKAMELRMLAGRSAA